MPSPISNANQKCNAVQMSFRLLFLKINDVIIQRDNEISRN